MADGITIEIKGIRETQRALYAYSQQLGDRVILGALNQGARLVQREARRRAPVLTGTVKRGIVVRKSKIYSPRRGGNQLGVYLTLRRGRGRKDKKDAFYGRFVEDGYISRGGNAIPAKQFIKGAFQSMRENAVRLIVLSVESGAEIVKRKVGLK